MEAPMEPTDRPVTEFLTQLDDPKKRSDSKVLVEMMTRVTGKKPKIWGRDIVGFGQYHYKYASGTEGDAPLAAFSPRKAEFSIYLWAEDSKERSDLLSRLGKHRMGKGCLYVKRLEQVDLAVLEGLVRHGAETAKATYQAK
jgi:hypothetical protein